MDFTTVEEFLLDTGLYTELKISPSVLDELEKLYKGDFQLDTFCIDCGKDSTFSPVTTKGIRIGAPSNPPIVSMSAFVGVDDSSEKEVDEYEILEQFEQFQQKEYEDLVSKNKEVVKKLACARNKEHTLIFYVLTTLDTIQKIGQFPSLADLTRIDISKYRKVISKEKLNEFKKAIGLSAHGVGIGSFVYLRRIFEELIGEAYKQAKLDPTWIDEEYQRKRMDEKILCLKGYLPNFLVENRTIYGILSKGVHELSEEECLGMFPAVCDGIELILIEKLREIESKEKAEKASKEISKLTSKLK